MHIHLPEILDCIICGYWIDGHRYLGWKQQYRIRKSPYLPKSPMLTSSLILKLYSLLVRRNRLHFWSRPPDSIQVAGAYESKLSLG